MAFKAHSRKTGGAGIKLLITIAILSLTTIGLGGYTIYSLFNDTNADTNCDNQEDDKSQTTTTRQEKPTTVAIFREMTAKELGVANDATLILMFGPIGEHTFSQPDFVAGATMSSVQPWQYLTVPFSVFPEDPAVTMQESLTSFPKEEYMGEARFYREDAYHDWKLWRADKYNEGEAPCNNGCTEEEDMQGGLFETYEGSHKYMLACNDYRDNEIAKKAFADEWCRPGPSMYPQIPVRWLK